MRYAWVILSSVIVLSACSVLTPGFLGDTINSDRIQPALTTEVGDLLFSSYPSRTATPSRTSKPTSTSIATSTPPAATNTPIPSATPLFKLCSPLAPHSIADLPKIISDPFRPPPPGKDFRHHGVDFAHYQFGGLKTIQGVIVQSILIGKIAASISNTYPFGNMVIVETPFRFLPVELTDTLQVNRDNSLYVLYAHLENTPEVNLNDQVNPCTPIGAVGKSGNAGIYHLHLETRSGKPGAQFPVMGYYFEDATEEQKSYYEKWRVSGEFLLLDPMVILDPKWTTIDEATLSP
ncbi:MAG: M23 family metallopeptidase [Anaerolineales bacterium]